VEELLCQLLNTHQVNSIWHSEIYSAEPFVPDSSPVEAGITVEEFNRYKLPFSDQIFA
jgi:hypothetical protein